MIGFNKSTMYVLASLSSFNILHSNCQTIWLVSLWYQKDAQTEFLKKAREKSKRWMDQAGPSYAPKKSAASSVVDKKSLVGTQENMQMRTRCCLRSQCCCVLVLRVMKKFWVYWALIYVWIVELLLTIPNTRRDYPAQPWIKGLFTCAATRTHKFLCI